MSIRVCFVALCAAVAMTVACENRASLPVSPSNNGQSNSMSIAGPGTVQRFTAVTDHGHTVTLSDGCDPDTFNAMFGDGTCIRPGGVQLPNFLEDLRNHGSAGAWHMAPNEVTLKVGEVLSAFNHGGEVHSFTEVKEFGGGFFQPINEILGLAEVPECAQAQAAGAVLKPGESSSEVENDEGVEHYQCCIHPWMRAEVRIVAR
jgi:plastocyanin